MLKGSIVLQIAALTHESDALAMADALQRKKFPVFRCRAIRRQFLPRAGRSLSGRASRRIRKERA